MIMKLKMCTTGKTFGNVCLKAAFFFNMWSAIKLKDRVRHEGEGRANFMLRNYILTQHG